jgi:urease accessory protein
MTTEPGGAGLYRLLAWASPAFPIGAFSYSHGLEAAADGSVHDRATLETWIEAIIVQGSGRVDADILRDAYRAAEAGDEAALTDANRRGCAYRATAELALESGQQGAAFLAAYEAAWASPHPPAAARRAPPSPACGRGVFPPTPSAPLPLAGEGGDGRSPATGEGVCHAAVFGAATARAGVALGDALTAYLQAFAANLMSAGLRLGIVGQSDGQRILAALEPVVAGAVEAALARDQENFGAATFAADLASMAHETQYTRLFRS